MSWKALVVSAALVLGTAGMAAAQTSTQSRTTTNATAKTVVHHEMGTVSSVTNSDLVLAHQYKTKQESTVFTLEPNTKKVGTIDKGTRVEVYYKNQNNQHVATEIKAEPRRT